MTDPVTPTTPNTDLPTDVSVPDIPLVDDSAGPSAPEATIPETTPLDSIPGNAEPSTPPATPGDGEVDFDAMDAELDAAILQELGDEGPSSPPSDGPPAPATDPVAPTPPEVVTPDPKVQADLDAANLKAIEAENRQKETQAEFTKNQQKLKELEEKVAKLSDTPGPKSQEELDLMAEIKQLEHDSPAIAALVNRQVKMLVGETLTERDKIAKEAADKVEKERQEATFQTGLRAEVPDFDKLDQDPRYKDWLSRNNNWAQQILAQHEYYNPAGMITIAKTYKTLLAKAIEDKNGRQAASHTAAPGVGSPPKEPVVGDEAWAEQQVLADLAGNHGRI